MIVMPKCYIIRVWRRVGIDLFKIWLIYKEDKENIVLSENIDKLLSFVVNDLIPKLNNELWKKMRREFGEELFSELKLLEDELVLYGNYDSDLEPILGYEYLWWEILAGSFDNLSPKLDELIHSDKQFSKTGTYGTLFKKSLIWVEDQKYPIKLHYGLYITQSNECTSY